MSGRSHVLQEKPGQPAAGEETHRRSSAATQAREDRRAQLIEALNGDLAREYQAIIAYTIYSQMLRGPQYMAIAKELETHAGEELQHAIRIARQIDYLGGTPTARPDPVSVPDDAVAILRADLQNELETIRHYRARVVQCEAEAEFAMAEEIREILRDEQEHVIDLATALGEDVPRL